MALQGGYELINEAGASPFVILCPHASSHIPAFYGLLGLSNEAARSHIAVDIGARELTLALSRALDCVALLGIFSRLVIDLNRLPVGERAIPARSGGVCIPGNMDLGSTEWARRVADFHAPFHRAVTTVLDRRRERRRPTTIIDLHTFTPLWQGARRPWHVGVAHDGDMLSRAVMNGLADDPALVVGDNEPYALEPDDFDVPVHGKSRGLPTILLEVRNDQLASLRAQQQWCATLTRVLRQANSGQEPST